MSLATKYNPSDLEDKWYKHWMEQKFFASKPDPKKEPYTIVIPPPNVTGVLHMGHMMNNTIQDVLIRRARMQGKEACWVPGMDHASIATEAKVVNMLKEKGINKNEISRDEFMKHAWEWKEKYGGIILQQLKKLGASCDWDRERFTMEEDMSAAVIEVFVDLYKKGYIYRGTRMVNWDPEGKTALADDEVNFKEVQGKMYHIRYQIEGSDDHLIIATTRPETIMADAAICINPNDERFTHLKGKRAIIPLIDKAIPIIEDDYVDMEFGTGCLKVTPAHDINDHEIGLRHNLEVIDIIADNGQLNEKAQILVGEDRFVARKKIAKLLKEKDQLEKEEDYTNNVGHSERTNAVIEPKLSTQWFVKMEELVKPAYENVMNDNIKLIPPKFKNTYKHWMENVRDWCISRQLWWGQRIPAYFMPNGDFVVAQNAEEALKLAKEKTGNQDLKAEDLNQDEDVLDTWFSSWLWPISVFDGFKDPDNEDFNYYYPTNDLVTGPDILFFWVARMIIAGYEFKGELPFKNVYLTGIVRDDKGRKMSKQLGNSPDALGLIDKHGADGVRVGLLLSAAAGNDLLFEEKLCEQGWNFGNKIWNAYRLVEGLEVKEKDTPIEAMKARDWFEARFQDALREINDHFSKFRISDALMATYKLIWDDFCSYYLELVKPPYGEAIDKETYEATITFFEDILTILHPFIPFLTEEIWHQITERDDKDCVIVNHWPIEKDYDRAILHDAKTAFELVSQIRNIRASKGISPKEALTLHVKTNSEMIYQEYISVIDKLANIDELAFTNDKIDQAVSFFIGSDECFIPMEGTIDVEKEKEEIQKELEYNKGFLKSVKKKLENERFVSNAPAQVVEMEKKKQADAEAKIKTLEESLENLK
ncbi:valine--tRNA ligase [Marivirga tractuosa]|uniref:Valine--tRNA ligase n=1 Tax=Marivirga tractuosa (strain ATCC 23168 / DSM 4126 / NBRC 15989 / NCIMB 1408 / VKM B-1430 / H-43) TaxID=643867 RepID=E4TSK3_MARTH|nr:valine--tRNA ligase [Marivirga tractuosa]ADR20823.1 valyl-tRNA synthetase [Marivirga tractuosa DSM 4126]BDD14726.1 valine--tRNA ligase [Marivirga tractuosa]